MRTGNHTISELQIHIVWVTKYRYKVLQGKIQERCREIIIQICDAEDIRILSGVVSKEMVQEYLEHHRIPSNKVKQYNTGINIWVVKRISFAKATYALSVHSG